MNKELHNLTSDAEPEEMISVSRKRVQELYSSYDEEYKTEENGSLNKFSLSAKISMLQDLFGSQCLPEDRDNLSPEKSVEPSSQNPPENCDNGNHISTDDNKPAEPKFKVGNKVRVVDDVMHDNRYNGTITEIVAVDPSDPMVPYKVDIYDDESGGGLWYRESELEPYTEPDTSHETPFCENHSGNTSQKDANKNSNRNLLQETENCDKHFDNIIKDSFSKERRLNIATQMVKAIMQCPEAVERIASAETDSFLDDILHDAFCLTDRLLAECEKGGSHEKA